MAIIIKKKAKPAEPPKPAVKQEPYVPYKSEFVGKEPKVCKACKHTYMKPCDGENPDCQNLLFVKGQLKGYQVSD